MLRGGTVIAVVGSVNEDVIFEVPQLPRPGETVTTADHVVTPGGKGANQAVAAARVGGDVNFIGCVGRDASGDRAIAALVDEGIIPRVHRVDHRATGTAFITVDARGENSIVVSTGANGSLTMVDEIEDLVRRADVVLAQLEVPMAVVQLAARHATGTFILNAAPARHLPDELIELVDVLVVNEHELRTISGGVDAVAARSIGVATVVATFGAKGAQVVTTNDIGFVPALDVTVRDSTGAGDTFCGVLAARIDGGDDVFAATAFATVAGSLATTRVGAREAMPTLERVTDEMGRSR